MISVVARRAKTENGLTLTIPVQCSPIYTSHNISSKFEAADVTRALWSVGLICDAGSDVKFNKNKASVMNSSGVELCAFNRENGLYVANVKVRNPKHPDFQRPGR